MLAYRILNFLQNRSTKCVTLAEYQEIAQRQSCINKINNYCCPGNILRFYALRYCKCKSTLDCLYDACLKFMRHVQNMPQLLRKKNVASNTDERRASTLRHWMLARSDGFHYSPFFFPTRIKVQIYYYCINFVILQYYFVTTCRYQYWLIAHSAVAKRSRRSEGCSCYLVTSRVTCP